MTKIAPKTEKLAKIYLEGTPAEISEETSAEFCEFIMSQFRALPLPDPFRLQPRRRD